MFTCPPIPESKRPELKQSKSTAWSWPRLVTVQNQKAQTTSSKRHSAAPSLRRERQRDRAPDAIEEQPPPGESALSPINSTAGSAPPTEGSDSGCTIDRHSRVSSVTDSEDEPRECIDECEEDFIHEERTDKNSKISKHQSEHDDNNPDVLEHMEKDENKNQGSVEHPKAESSSTSSASLSSSSGPDSASEQRFPKMISTPAKSIEQDSSTVSASDERDPSMAPGPSKSTKQDSLSSIDDEGNTGMIQGPAKPFEKNGKTVPEEGAQGAKIRPGFETTTIPGESSRPGVPKIKVQEPSEASLGDPARPRTIDDILAEQHRISTQQAQQIRDMAPGQQVSEMVSLPPIPTDLSGLKAAGAPKTKKRQLVIRKARNIAARKIVLKAALGRTLAVPTKLALKRLANGEVVTLEDLPVCT